VLPLDFDHVLARRTGRELDERTQQYVRDHLALRTEATSNNVRDFGVPKAIEQLPHLRDAMAAVTPHNCPSFERTFEGGRCGWMSPEMRWRTCCGEEGFSLGVSTTTGLIAGQRREVQEAGAVALREGYVSR